jgi:hypothetical protein
MVSSEALAIFRPRGAEDTTLDLALEGPPVAEFEPEG